MPHTTPKMVFNAGPAATTTPPSPNSRRRTSSAAPNRARPSPYGYTLRAGCLSRRTTSTSPVPAPYPLFPAGTAPALTLQAVAAAVRCPQGAGPGPPEPRCHARRQTPPHPRAATAAAILSCSLARGLSQLPLGNVVRRAERLGGERTTTPGRPLSLAPPSPHSPALQGRGGVGCASARHLRQAGGRASCEGVVVR